MRPPVPERRSTWDRAEAGMLAVARRLRCQSSSPRVAMEKTSSARAAGGRRGARSFYSARDSPAEMEDQEEAQRSSKSRATSTESAAAERVRVEWVLNLVCFTYRF